jgi:DNA-binding CsgD family transcriptional regulator
LQTGNLAGASAAFGHVFDPRGIGPVLNPRHASALVALAYVATRTGDDRAARTLAALARTGLAHGGRAVRRHAAWLLAQQAMATEDAVAARAFLSAVGDSAAIASLPVLMMDAEAAPTLVRIALAAGDGELAHAVASRAADLERRNPRVGSLASAAAHARGLVGQDPAALREAGDLLARGPRVLFRASAIEDLGAELARRGEKESAVDALDQSLRLYARSGATWDASRVRRRLRALGVRRRLVTPPRQTTGWPSLTDAEVAVVRLVAEALSNREVAQRLFLSPHTVSMHLRHAYLKLGINTRVELTRIALAHDR